MYAGDIKMIINKEKISTKQILYIYLVILFSPSVRLIPSFSAQKAKQASWLTPTIGFIALIILFIIIQKIYNSYKNFTFMEIIYDITGSYIGRIIVLVYIIWVTILLALYTRYYGERIIGSIFPNVNINIFIIPMIIFVAYAIRYDIIIIARMNEILFPVILSIFFLFIIFLIPRFEINNLTPLCYIDIIPVLKGSAVSLAIWGYLPFLFVLSDKIKDTQNIYKHGKYAALFLLIATTFLIAMTVGTLGSSVVERLPLPFLVAVKQISIFGTLEKIESMLVTLWIASDFTIISVFSIIILKMIKSFLKLSDIKPFINIFCVFIYFFSLCIAKSRFELEEFSKYIAIPVNIVLEFIIPIVIFIIGKLRKKI